MKSRLLAEGDDAECVVCFVGGGVCGLAELHTLSDEPFGLAGVVIDVEAERLAPFPDVGEVDITGDVLLSESGENGGTGEAFVAEVGAECALCGACVELREGVAVVDPKHFAVRLAEGCPFFPPCTE